MRFLFINVKLQYIGIALVVVDILQIPNGNAGGRLAHLGGAFLGFLYAKQLQKGNDIGSGLDRIWNFRSSLFTAKNAPNMHTVHHPTTVSKKKTQNGQQQKIDAILDKISTSGYESLTQEEKDFLFRAGKDN